MVGTRPRHRRRPPGRVLAARWAMVLAVLGGIITGITFGVEAATGGHSSKPVLVAGHGSTTTTRAAPSTTTTAPPNPITLTAVGDMELGDTPQLPASPATYLDPVRSALAADIVFGNLEGTLTDSTGSKCGASSTQCFAFRTPPSYAQYLKADGFTVLNSANNHSHDFGAAGVTDTSAALQAAGIVQAGLPGQIGLVTSGATKVAFVDFAPYVTTNSLLDLAGAKSLIEQARHEASIVVVYMHAGAEGSAADHVTGQEEQYLGEDRGNPEAFAHAAIDDGASLVIASGPHVLRGMEFYRGSLIAYSLGNFAGFHNFATGGNLSLSGILKVSLDGHGRFVSGSFVSVDLASDDQPYLDPSGSAAQLVAQLSSEDFGATAAVFHGGTITPPAGTA